MKISKKRRYIILFAACLIIIRVLSCSIIPDISKNVNPDCKPMNTKEQISSIEADKFLQDWVEYINKGYHNLVPEKISLIEGSLDEHLPLPVKVWFNKKCWSAKRFYYVEDRLRTTLQMLYLRRHSESILAILNERMNGENEAEYKNIIEMQKNLIHIENISEEELKFVAMSEAEIVKILNMR